MCPFNAGPFTRAEHHTALGTVSEARPSPRIGSGARKADVRAMQRRHVGETFEWIPMSDGTRLAATLYLPDSDEPQPALLEALPYRKDDATQSYAPEYRRLCDEFDYAVCRVDVRGTGSSEGLATDEYPPQEQKDMREVIAWLARQDWCTGKIGMYGTSYSGFNSIQVAMTRPP